MADGDLIFPIKFDLESTLATASTDANRILLQMQRMLDSQPLKIKVDLANGGKLDTLSDIVKSNAAIELKKEDLKNIEAAEGSIISMRQQMANLTNEWEKLGQATRTATDSSGNFTGRAGEIIKEFAQLTLAMRDHGKTLQELQREADKAAIAQIKADMKQAEHERKLGNQQTTIEGATYALKLFREELNKIPQFTINENGVKVANQEWVTMSKYVQQLATDLDKLKRNTDQATESLEKINARKAAESVKQAQDWAASSRAKYQQNQREIEEARKAAEDYQNLIKQIKAEEKLYAGKQKDIAGLSASLQAHRKNLETLPVGSKEFESSLKMVNDLTAKMEKFNKVVADAQALRTFTGVINLANDSLGNLQQKLSAVQNALTSDKYGTDEWKKGARLAAEYAKEIAHINQYINDYQQKAFEGLRNSTVHKQVEEVQKLRAEIDKYNTQYNVLNAQGKAYGQDGKLTNNAYLIIEKRAKAEENLNKIIRSSDSALEAYNKRLKEQDDYCNHLIARLDKLASTMKMLSASEQRVANLNSKIQYYQELISKQQYGGDVWKSSVITLTELNDKLQRANQMLADYQNKAFKGLSPDLIKVNGDILTRLRDEISALDKQIHSLYQFKNNTGSLSRQDEALLAQSLDERAAKVKQMSDITTSAADLQLKREQEINRLIERRKQYTSQKALLASDSKSIDVLTRKLEYYRNLLNKLDPNTKGQTFLDIAEKVKELSKELKAAEENLRRLTGEMQNGSSRQTNAVNKTNSALKTQEGYISRLIQRLAVYASIQAVGNFVNSVREVTAQFELQRVSLGAILQDQAKAEKLFGEIKTFALTSPVSILDLTKYTKQLAAYKIGYEELFETTKKLTDVSVGLGVSMDRVILAYGQVRATGHLRASEIRQFTEMGVPIVEELAAKLTKLNGELVTSAQVMDMVSKRGISFQMVKEVFDDMTSAGGIFYNMQEKQGNTLHGLWAKLGDAASVMYDQIGNTDYVNDNLKTFINTATDIMRNWKAAFAAISFGIAPTILGFVAWRKGMDETTKASQRARLATERRIKAEEARRLALANGTVAEQQAANAAHIKAAADERAAIREEQRAKSMGKLATGLRSLGKSAAMAIGSFAGLAIITAIIYKIAEAISEAGKLQEKLSEIKDNGFAESERSVHKFKRLADAALDAADGSKAQRESLEELQRTYKDMIPVEDLSLQNLIKMRKEGYEPLTAAIEDYIAKRTVESEMDAVAEHYGSDSSKRKRDIRMSLKRGHFGSWWNLAQEGGLADTGKHSDEQITDLINYVEKAARKSSKAWKDIWKEAIMEIIPESEQSQMLGALNQSFFFQRDAEKIVENIRNEAAELKALNKEFETTNEKMSKYRTLYLETKASLADIRLKGSDGRVIDSTTFLGSQMANNARVKEWVKDIRTMFKMNGLQIQDDWNEIISKVDFNAPFKISTINFSAIFNALDANKGKLGKEYEQLKNAVVAYQNLYLQVAPDDRTMNVLHGMMFKFSNEVDKTGAVMDKVKLHLANAGESMADYKKRVKDAIETTEEQLKSLQRMRDAFKNNPTWANLKGIGGVKQEEIDQANSLLKILQMMFQFLGGEEKKNKGRESDPRLGILQEMANSLKTINKEYIDLSKTMGSDVALSRIKKTYRGTFAEMESLNQKYKFGLPLFEIPKDTTELNNYLGNIQTAMRKLKNSDKAVLGLGTDAEKNVTDDLQKTMEKALKAVETRIARSRIMRDFYENILTQTGDKELADNIAERLFGGIGEDLFTAQQEQIQKLFVGQNGKAIPILSAVDFTNEVIDYAKLSKLYEKYQNDIVEANRDALKKIIEQGQDASGKQILEWYKQYAKTKDFEQQRLDIIGREAQVRESILKSTALTEEEKQKLLNASRKKEREDLAAVEHDVLTQSDLYIKAFSDLGKVSKASLTTLREHIKKIMDTQKDLSPEKLKALASAYDKLGNELRGRSFGAGLVDSFKKLLSARKALKDYKYDPVKDEGDMREAEDALAKATKNRVEAQGKLNSLIGSEGANAEFVTAAQIELNQAEAEENKALMRKKGVQERITKSKNKEAELQDDVLEAQNELTDNLNKMAASAQSTASFLGEVKDLIGVSADSAEGLAFDSAIEGLNAMSSVLGIIATMVLAIEAELTPLLVAAASLAAIVGTIKFFSGNSVRKKEEEIKSLTEQVENLEYAFTRLEKAAEKMFGTDYISNYNQQMVNLEARHTAYLKQAQLERDKGKKADKEKIKQYEQSARDTMDTIKEKQEELTSKFVGSNMASTAQAFAEAWLDARIAFENTSDAIQSKYKDLIRNMVIQGAASKLIQQILDPIYAEMDKRIKGGNIQSAISYLTENMATVVGQTNSSLEVLYAALKKEGMDLAALSSSSEATGIARNFATASEESIAGLTAMYNTNNYYASFIPQIHSEVVAMRQLAERQSLSGSDASSGTALQNQAMSHLSAISGNTAVIAQRASETLAELRKVIIPKGATSGFGVNVFMK